MSNTSEAQEGGRTGNFERYRQPSESGHKRDLMDFQVAPYRSVPPSTATTQQVQTQEARRPVLPTSVVAAYTAGPPHVQRMPSQPTLPAQGLHRNIENTNEGMTLGLPGHSLDPYKSQADHQRRPSEQAYRDDPPLNFQYVNTTLDSNQAREQQQLGRPYQALGQQYQQQPQQAMLPLPQRQSSSSVASSPTALHPPPTNGLSRIALVQQHQQQRQQIIFPPPQRQPSSSVLPSPIAPRPPPTNAPPRKPSTSQAPMIHPGAIKVTANALKPIQHLYEEAWVRTVANVQHEISRMHSELTRLLEAERRQNQTMRTERDAALEEAKRLREENAEMREGVKRTEAKVQRVVIESEEQSRRLQANNGVLHHQGQAQMLRVQAGEQVQKDAMDSTVKSIRIEFAKQFELEMAVRLKELQEQKAMRVLAEKKLAEATRQLKRITDGLLSASSEQERQCSESATVIGTPEMQLSKLKDEHEDDCRRGPNPIARGSRIFGSHQPLRGTSISPLTQTSSPQIKQGPGSTRLTTPPPHPPPVPSRRLTPASLSLPSPHPHPSEAPQAHHNHDQRNRPPVLHPIVTSDGQLCDARPEERPASSAALRPDLNQQPPRSTTPVPSSVPLSPPPSERRPLLAKGDCHYSPSRACTRSTSLQLQSNHSPSSPSHHPFPVWPEPHSSPPFAEPYKPTVDCSPSASRLAVPPSPAQSSPDRRTRKRGRTEFERDGSSGGSGTEAGEYRRLVPARLVTDPSDDRERSRPRLKLDKACTDVQLATPEITSASMAQSSPNAPASSSSSIGAGLLEEGELLATPETNASFEAGEVDTVPVDVKPQIDKATSARARPNKIGINHMDLLYETRGDQMVCRMCRNRPRDAEKLSPPIPMSFSTKATWAELVGHYKTRHPKGWGDLERLSPSQIGELRQRMVASSSFGFMLK